MAACIIECVPLARSKMDLVVHFTNMNSYHKRNEIQGYPSLGNGSVFLQNRKDVISKTQL